MALNSPPAAFLAKRGGGYYSRLVCESPHKKPASLLKRRGLEDVISAIGSKLTPRPHLLRREGEVIFRV